MSSPTEPRSQSSPPDPLQRWLAEMKRRKVFRLIAVYGAVSFVVLEAADVIFPAIPLPPWTISLVLYLLLLGFPIAVVLAWAFEMTPHGVQRTVAAAPEEIESIVAAPARTRWPAGLLALGGLALLAAAFYGGRASVRDPGGEGEPAPVEAEAGPTLTYVDLADDPRPAIAVLPFEDMSPEGDQEYFSDGISAEIITVLSKIRDLRVAARASAFAYKGRNLDLRQVGGELAVPFLLDGTVRKEGDQLRITAELVNAADGFPVWSATFDRQLAGVFVIQTEIAEAIAAALRVPLGLASHELVSPTNDMEALDLYLNGRAALRRRGTGVAEAIELFEAAVMRDSAWAPPWASLAVAHAASPHYVGLGGEDLEPGVWARSLAASESAALRALELDPKNAEALVALGMVHGNRWEWEEGEASFLRALSVDPDSEEAHTQYAELLWGMGRLEESMRETGRALALDRSAIRLDVHAFALYMNGQFRQAETVLEDGLAMDPSGEVPYLRQIFADLMLFDGRYKEALARFGSFIPDSTAYRRMGEALEAGDAALLPETAGRGWPATLVLLGENDRALDAIEEMVLTKPFRIHYDLWHPLLAPIRDTRRFRNAILPRVRLEGAEARYATQVDGP